MQIANRLGRKDSQRRCRCLSYVFKDSSPPVDCVFIMRLPTVEQLGADVEVLQREAETLPVDDLEALLQHLGKLRTLAVYLNAHVVAPIASES